MIYLTRDGELFGGPTAEAAVADLRSKSKELLDRGQSDRGWMLGLASRARTQTGSSIRIDNAEEFIADLIQAGLVLQPQ